MGTVPTHTILSSTDYGTVSAYDKALGGSAMMNMTYHGSQRTKTFELCGGNPFDKYEMDIIREQLSVHKAGGALCSFGIAFPWHYEGVLYTPSGRPFAGRKAEKITSDIIWKQLDIIEDKCRKVKEFGFDSLIADLSCDTMITQFMAPGFNDRDDEWGGSFENRARAGVEFIRRARKAVGPDFVIELRMSAELFMPGSYTFEELCKFVGMVKDEIDFAILPSEFLPGNAKDEEDADAADETADTKAEDQKDDKDDKTTDEKADEDKTPEELLKEENERLSDTAERLATLTIPMLVDRSADEKTDLAKAEWLKVYGVIFGCEDQANELFQQMVKAEENK